MSCLNLSNSYHWTKRKFTLHEKTGTWTTKTSILNKNDHSDAIQPPPPGQRNHRAAAHPLQGGSDEDLGKGDRFGTHPSVSSVVFTKRQEEEGIFSKMWCSFIHHQKKERSRFLISFYNRLLSPRWHSRLERSLAFGRLGVRIPAVTDLSR